jgi:hypothetical protein
MMYQWISLMDMWLGYLRISLGHLLDISSGYLFLDISERYPILPKDIQEISFHIQRYPEISNDIQRYPNGANSQMLLAAVAAEFTGVFFSLHGGGRSPPPFLAPQSDYSMLWIILCALLVGEELCASCPYCRLHLVLHGSGRSRFRGAVTTGRSG